MNQSRTDEVMRLTDIIVKADSRWSGLQETREALRSAVQAMEDELAAAGKWHALMQRAAHALGLMAGTDLLAELIPAIERLAAAKQGEIVMWQYRSYFDENTVTPGWSKWNPVEPRNIHTTTVQDMVDEIKAFIAQGSRYEIRALFDHAAPVQEGWQLVPVEPTDYMRSHGAEAYVDTDNGADFVDIAGAIYRAMLAAAPSTGETL